MTAVALEGYERLADLFEQELALASAGEFDGIDALHAERDALIADLPESPPPAARPALERAVAAQRALAQLLTVARDQVAAELRHLARGRAAARSYAPATAPPAPALDRPA